MTSFAYKGRASDGTQAEGRIEAETSYRARADLAQRGFFDLDLTERRGALHFELTKKKVKRQEIMHFSRQLSAFVRAGVPIVSAIEVIAREVQNDLFQQILREIRDALRSGETFADALTRHQMVFPRYYLDIVRSAELTGSLDTVLDQLAGYLERDLEARHRITSALLYPCLVLGMAVVTIVVLTGFVLPRFKVFFASFNAKLPLATRILIGFGDFVGTFWWAILLAIATVSVSLFLGLRTENGKVRRDTVLLRLYAVGSVVRFSILERFCRILSAMVRAGVPLPDALAVATDTTANRVFKKALVVARDRLIAGEGLADPLDGTGLFPGVARQMVRVGEETGTLDQQLETAANFYSIELEFKVKRLTTLFEPAIILFVGLVVGFVAIALVSAMYGIYRQVKI